ncbi:hypothetical protein MEX01_49710 [Methylorubrum extorquens]|nr:hypothetical protein MEX01_49710 [Methylorubrum extorquens]
MNHPCVGMRKGGRSAAYIFGVWCTIAILSGLAALVGNVALTGTSPEMIAATTAVAAGAILAMLADTMTSEAFETAHLCQPDHRRGLPLRLRAGDAW